MPLVTLIGYRGTGKSTVARLLADSLATTWVDADAVLEEQIGCTITSLVHERGEAVFRDAEADVLAHLLTTVHGVLATGGGVILREANRRLLVERGRPLVWLTAPLAAIRQRLATDPATAGRRPALQGNDVLAEVEAAVREREPLYRACADLEIDTSTQSPAAVAEQIVAWLGLSAEATEQRGPS